MLFNYSVDSRGNKTLLLNRETGRWVFLDDDNHSINNLMKTNTGVLDFDKIRSFVSENDIAMLVKEGIISSDTKIVPEKPAIDTMNLLILDLTNKCNLACNYCSVDTGESGKLMDSQTALSALEQVLDLDNVDENLTIEFSGGEPLLNYELLYSFVHNAKKIAEKSHIDIKFTIQTNGILLNEDRINFLIDNNVEIGLSIDGTKKVNDKNRVFRNGTGTFDIIIQNIHKIKSLGGKFSVICVITCPEQFDDIYNLCMENDIFYIRTNLVTDVGRGKDLYKMKNMDFVKYLATSYIDFCKKIIPKNKIYEANSTYYLWNLLGYQPHMCFRVPCGAALNQIHIDANGDIYPCQDWRSIHDKCLGNIHTDSLKSILKTSQRVIELNTRSTQEMDSCRKCNWKMFCGVCPRKIYSETKKLSGFSYSCVFQNLVFNELIWEYSNNKEAIKNYLLHRH